MAMEMKALILKLLPQLTCYKCKSIPRADDSYKTGYKCLNPNDFHFICEKCKGKCPCNFNVSKKPCELASSLLEMLPFCCKNRKAGCEEILCKEEMKSHHEECIFEKVTCIHKHCRKEMPFKSFLDHLGSAECIRILDVGKDAKFILPFRNTMDGDGWSPRKIESNPLNEPLFYLVGLLQNEIAHFWIYYIGFKNEADRFSYSLEVGDKSFYYVNFVGPVKSIFESFDDILKARDIFMIGTSALRRICNEDKLFECVLNIIDKKAEAQDSEDDSGVSDEQ